MTHNIIRHAIKITNKKYKINTLAFFLEVVGKDRTIHMTRKKSPSIW
jgi:hypothetical protein